MAQAALPSTGLGPAPEQAHLPRGRLAKPLFFSVLSVAVTGSCKWTGTGLAGTGGMEYLYSLHQQSIHESGTHVVTQSSSREE